MGKRVNMTKNKTALFNLHQTNKAKFVEFAGYEMPIQYEKGIVEEHKITRSAAGIFDVSHMGQHLHRTEKVQSCSCVYLNGANDT